MFVPISPSPSSAIKPWLYLAVAVLWLASLVGVGWWQRGDGRAVERSAWEERENKALRAANVEIQRLNDAARQRERDHAYAVTAISTHLQKELDHAKTQLAHDRAAVRAGSLRLFDPAAGLRACGGLSAPSGTGPRGRDGSSPGELSRAAAEFLFDLAADADDTARQLAACQRVVIEDRRVEG